MGTGEEKKTGVDRRRRRAAHARKRARRAETGRREAGGKGRKKKNQKRAAFDVVSGTILIVAVCVFVFSLYQLVMMLVPYHTGGQEYDEI